MTEGSSVCVQIRKIRRVSLRVMVHRPIHCVLIMVHQLEKQLFQTVGLVSDTTDGDAVDLEVGDQFCERVVLVDIGLQT